MCVRVRACCRNLNNEADVAPQKNKQYVALCTIRLCIVHYCPLWCYLLPSAVKCYQQPSNLLSNTLSPYCCLLHPCKPACRIVILYFKYLYFPLASGMTNKECKTKWQHAFGEVRVCWQTAVLQVTLYLGLCA